MKVIDNILFTIDRFPKGYVFTYTDFMSEVNMKESVIKALNLLSKSGKIEKLAKGKFYKPETTSFGKLEPKQYQIVKDLLEENGKLIGYLTGYSIYNQLGLTTQISNKIQIGKKDIRPPMKRNMYLINFIKQKNTITKDNIPLLQILDSIRYIKRIPDSSPETACIRFISILKELTDKDKSTLVRLAMKYPPSTRALTGAMLEEIGFYEFTEDLIKSLNPITDYKLFGIEKVLTNADKWGFKK